MKKTVKKIFKVLGIVLGVILLVLIAYIFYLYASYHRIEDNLVLEVESAPDAGEDLEGLTSGARPDSASARYNTDYRGNLLRTDLQPWFRCLHTGLQFLHGRRQILLGKKQRKCAEHHTGSR